MNCIFLSGNSIENKNWIIEIEKSFRNLFDKSYVQMYKHWRTDNPYIDLEYEQEVLKNNSNNFDDNYVVFAKSVGTILAVKSVKKGILNPQKCIFVGVPVNWAKKRRMDPDSVFYNFDIPTLFIQHTHDPICSSSDLKEFIESHKVQNYKFIEIEGNTHDYSEIELLKEKVKKYIFD